MQSLVAGLAEYAKNALNVA